MLAVLGVVLGFGLPYLALQQHVVEDLLFEVGLRSDHVPVLDGVVLLELLPNLVGGDRPSEVKQLGHPQVRAVDHEPLRGNFDNLFH